MEEQTGVSHSTIVLVDDEPEILFSFGIMLRRAGFSDVKDLQDSRELLPLLARHEAGAVVLDLQMPYLSGKELLGEITSSYPEVPVIIMTAANQLDTAVDCMKEGAFDYLVKPVTPDRFVSAIRKALEISSLRREIASLRESLAPGEPHRAGALSQFHTRSDKMQFVFAYLQGVAPSDQPVLVLGETGVGKELVARALHGLSGRTGEFVALNSAGLDDQVFADTLFGHGKGSFTGADSNRDGMVARAAGGTLFLDEIGDLAPASQVKLLRLLQEGEYYPIGSDRPRFSTARIVAATNCDLTTLVANGSFRKDLFFRLCSHQVRIPPLRERSEDIAPLLEVFLTEAAHSMGKRRPSFPPELIGYLSGYSFPGNIRELRAMVYDAVARHRGGVLSMGTFRDAIGHGLTSLNRDCPAADGFATLKEMEERLVEQALQRTGGNQGAAAALLGISRQALNKRLNRR
ncbi:sigma-54 dependent transcriptional regulator [Geomonas sp. Red32]|uniref:sigma-54-dependent transcriptional regulator n=1 Tax=Geomonas sp. Red32 TaxID=2912856 RepID=UPI00202CBE59|nr:sigma-54 dependent transcriptional regulator [Geomonas sp. Red32]MCM0081109.1 sigma-54 dependent transcriptional regulator [Geomonas sp. Red32]